jgi:hypothetical protein
MKINARKGKDQGVAVHSVKGYSGSRGKAPLIPDLSTSWMWVVSFTLQPFCPRDKTPLPIEQEVVWDPEPV